MRRYDGRHVHRHDLAILHHHAAVDHGRAGGLRGAEEDGGDGIVERAGIADRVQVEREEVGALAGFERADVGAAEHAGAAQGREFQRLARRHPFLGAHGMRR